MTTRMATLAYGSGSISLGFPGGFLAGEPIAPRLPGGGRRPAEAIAEALAAPLDSPALRDLAAGRRVGIVISDEFRAGLQVEIVDALLGEVARGGPASVTVMLATGSHDPTIYGAKLAVACREAAERHGIAARVHVHDCDRSPNHEVGTTPLGSPLILDDALLETDLRVYGHESKHHYMCGYSIIDKQVVPGMAMRRTIEANHKRALDPGSLAGRSPWHPDPSRRDNPFAEDARDARALSERRLLANGAIRDTAVATFALDMISEAGSVYWIAAGKPASVLAPMPEAADRMGAFEVERARYVAISPGGPPASQTLYSTQNCFDMALMGAVLPGGEALVIAPCEGRPDVPEDARGLAPDRTSKALFYDGLVRLLPMPFGDAEAWIREHFELYLWKTHRVLRLLKADGVRLYLHSRLPPDKVRAAGIEPVEDPQAWIDERAGRRDGKCHVIDGGNKLLVVGRNPAGA